MNTDKIIILVTQVVLELCGLTFWLIFLLGFVKWGFVKAKALLHNIFPNVKLFKTKQERNDNSCLI